MAKFLDRRFGIGHFFMYTKRKTKVVAEKVSGEVEVIEIEKDSIIPLVRSENDENAIYKIYISSKKLKGALEAILKDSQRFSFIIKTKTYPKLELGSLSTDRKIYILGETVRVIAIVPGRGGTNISFELYKEDQIIWRTSKKLSEYGTQFIEFEELDEGEYEITATVEGMTNIFSAKFTISKFRVSPLRTSLLNYEIKDSNIQAKISISKLERKYSGSITVGLFCGYCDEIVWSKEFQVEEGIIDVEVPIRGHTGPFELRINTPEGLTAAVSLKGTRIEERKEYLVGDMSKKVFVSLAPRKNSKHVRGLYYRVIQDSGILELEAIVSNSAKMRILRDIKKMVIDVYDPINETTELYIFENKKAGDLIEVPFNSPMISLLAGILLRGDEKDTLREHFSVIFKEDELRDIKIICNDVVRKPELNIKILPTIEKEGTVELFIIALDDRILRDDEESNIGKGYLDFMQEYSQLKMLPLTRGYNRGVISFGLIASPARAIDILHKLGKVRSASEINKTTEPEILYEETEEELSEEFEEAAISTKAKTFAVLTKKLPVLYFKRIEVEGNKEVNLSIYLGDELRTVRIEVIGIFGFSVRRFVKKVTIKRDYYLDILSPIYMDETDRCKIPIEYIVAKDATIEIETFEGIQTFNIRAGSGRVYVKVKGPTEILAHIKIDEKILFEKKAIIKKVGEEEITVSEIRILDPEQKINGDRLVVYPSIDYLIKDIAMSLVRYPYGCAEQTSAKLKGLLLIFQAFNGNNGAFLDKVKMLISAGSERMKLFFKGGLFSLWEDSKPDVNVTIKVLKNLRPVLNVDDPLVENLKSMISKSINELKKREVRDSELAEFDPAFISEIKTAEDAAHVLLALRNSKEDSRIRDALDFIMSNKIDEHNYIRWPAVKSWSGDLETTSIVLRALISYEGYSDRVKKGLKYVFSKIVGGMLYSTADTSALLDMIAELKDIIDPEFIVKIDGKDKKLEDIAIVKEITAKTYAIVRIDRKVKINELRDVAGNIEVNIDIDKRELKIGDVTKIRINIEGDTIIPISKIYLPPGLVAMIGGANVQTVTRVRSPITLDVIATRESEGVLRVLAKDMYASWKTGISKPIKIRISK